MSKNNAGSVQKSFEQALARLEAIVKEMESGKLTLDELVSRFEEGQSLMQFCTRKLNEVGRKIEVLAETGDGELTTRPFEDQTADAAAQPREEERPDLF